jgi:hypothetical protein
VTAPTTARKATPQQNRERKARLIARAAWRRGLTVKDLRVMPYSGEQRSLTRFARMAYRESDDVADHDVNPPSGPESRTWGLVAEYLAGMTARARAGLPCPERDLLADRQAWLPDDADPWKEKAGCPTPGSQDASSGSSSESPASGPSGNPPATADAPDAGTPTTAPSGFPAQRSSLPSTEPAQAAAAPPASADALPRGWAELAALPPLTYRSCIHHPDRRPVVITPDGGRCPDCPPRPGEIPVKWDPTPEQLASLFGKKGPEGVAVPFESVRDGWGMRLNWAPKHCNAPVRCYCGRCPTKPSS